MASVKAPPAAPIGWPVLRLGFRPFYLGAALLACVSVPLWVAVFLGQLAPAFALPPLLWHGHEMVFGFAAGVIIGFFSFLIAIYYLIMKLRFWDTFQAGMAPLVVGLFFFSGMILIFIGLLGEYMLSINTRIIARPLVIERKRLGFHMSGKTEAAPEISEK